MECKHVWTQEDKNLWSCDNCPTYGKYEGKEWVMFEKNNPTEKPILTIKTEDGLAEPMPLSDIQEYNRNLLNLTAQIERFGENINTNTFEQQNQRRAITHYKYVVIAFGVIGVIYVLGMTYYIISNNVFNNFVKALAGAG